MLYCIVLRSMIGLILRCPFDKRYDCIVFEYVLDFSMTYSFISVVWSILYSGGLLISITSYDH